MKRGDCNRERTGMGWVLTVPNVPRMEERSSLLFFCCLNVFTFLSINKCIRPYSHGHLHYVKQCKWVRLWDVLFLVLVRQWHTSHFPGAVCSASAAALLCAKHIPLSKWIRRADLFIFIFIFFLLSPHTESKSVWTWPKKLQLPPILIYLHLFVCYFTFNFYFTKWTLAKPDKSWGLVGGIPWHIDWHLHITWDALKKKHFNIYPNKLFQVADMFLVKTLHLLVFNENFSFMWFSTLSSIEILD